MGAKEPSAWKNFWSYFWYGVAACVFLVIPLAAVDWLLQSIPFLGKFVELLKGIDAPGVGVILGLLGAIIGIALMGWVLRRLLWNSLTQLPIIGTVLTSTQRFAEAVSHLDRTSRDEVAWVSMRYYRTLGVVVSRTTDEDGTEYANVYLLSGAGQFQGNQIVNVRVSDLVFPGWTIDEALVFSSAGGAVVPGEPTPTSS